MAALDPSVQNRSPSAYVLLPAGRRGQYTASTCAADTVYADWTTAPVGTPTTISVELVAPLDFMSNRVMAFNASLRLALGQCEVVAYHTLLSRIKTALTACTQLSDGRPHGLQNLSIVRTAIAADKVMEDGCDWPTSVQRAVCFSFVDGVVKSTAAKAVKRMLVMACVLCSHHAILPGVTEAVNAVQSCAAEHRAITAVWLACGMHLPVPQGVLDAVEVARPQTLLLHVDCMFQFSGAEHCRCLDCWYRKTFV